MISYNLYQILNIKPNATQTEIKQAYRELAKRFHPDGQQETANHQKIVEINAAYEILGDPQRRSQYDRQCLLDSPVTQRQQRTAAAQKNYKNHRQAEAISQEYLEQWFQEVYLPFNRYLSQILQPLSSQIDELAADPFDDQLMANFQEYLEVCRDNLEKAKFLFTLQPNPSEMAKVAASMYYCLNHLGDGLEDLETFTLNYDEHYLHSGQEMFRRVQQIRYEAKIIINQMGF